MMTYGVPAVDCTFVAKQTIGVVLKSGAGFYWIPCA